MEQVAMYWWDSLVVSYQEYWLYVLGFVAELLVVLFLAYLVAPTMARHLARKEIEMSSRHAWLKYWLRDKIVLDIEGARLKREISTNDAKFLYKTVEQYLPDLECMKHVGTIKKEVKERLDKEHKIPAELIPKKVEAMRANGMPARRTKSIKV